MTNRATMSKTTLMTLVDACGMESRGRKVVLDKEEMGQEVELVHDLAGEQMCCRGEGEMYVRIGISEVGNQGRQIVDFQGGDMKLFAEKDDKQW